MTPKQEAALETFDRRMKEAVGRTHEEYELLRASAHNSLERMQFIGELVDESGIVELLERWENQDRKSKAGRKPLFSYRAIVILLWMHKEAGDDRYKRIAQTLYAQMTPATRKYLGIPYLPGDQRDWYGRYWRAMNRVLALTRPWQINRKVHATPEMYKAALATYSQEKRDRMDELMNKLIHAPIHRLPADIRAAYAGNVAIDATLIEVVGEPNPNAENFEAKRLNLDPTSGRYRRGGRHDGRGGKNDRAGYEMETVVTIPNTPDAPDSFPVITTGLAFHQPGRIKHGPRIAMNFHAQEFSERGLILADRAYNGSKPHRFQKPTREMGFRHVFDYKTTQAGVQGVIDDVVFIGGRPYVNYMPPNLKTIREDFKARRIDRATHDARLEALDAYHLKDKGVPDADGRQRFIYPDLTKVACFDPATGKLLTGRQKPKTQATFLLSPDSPSRMRIVKHLSRFPHKSQKWRAWYGMRSHVESNNQYVKADAETDLGNPEKRRPRGYEFQALSAALAFAVSNMRRIVSYIKSQAMKDLDEKTLRRARRRTDEYGNRLKHHDE